MRKTVVIIDSTLDLRYITSIYRGNVQYLKNVLLLEGINTLMLLSYYLN